MAAHLLPDAGAAVLRLAVTPPSSARPGSQVKSLMSPPGEYLLLGRPNLSLRQHRMPDANRSAWSRRYGSSRAYLPLWTAFEG